MAKANILQICYCYFYCYFQENNAFWNIFLMAKLDNPRLLFSKFKSILNLSGYVQKYVRGCKIPTLHITNCSKLL